MVAEQLVKYIKSLVAVPIGTFYSTLNYLLFRRNDYRHDFIGKQLDQNVF